MRTPDGSDRGIPRAPTGTQLMHHGTLLLDGDFFILKAHGTLEDASSMVFTSEDYRRITHSNPAFSQMLSAILLSNAVLFVGYSLSDPNFRLLIEAQLSTFGTEVPRRYILMEAAGQAEEELLWRTARVRVLSYPKGRHELVARFLASLAHSVRETVAARGTVPDRPRRRNTARELAVQNVLRVELSARYSNLDATWSRIDVQGSRTANVVAAIPLAHGSGVLPAWHELNSVLKKLHWTNLPDAQSVPGSVSRRIGALLWRALPPELRGELASTRHKDVVVLAPSSVLECLPWEWIAIHGTPLFVRRPVVREPGDVSNTARGRPFVHKPPRLLLIGDSGSENLRLPGSRREVRKLASLASAVLPKANITLLVGRAASHDRVLSQIERGDHDLVHFTGHVGANGGEPFLLLYDGYVQVRI